MASKGLVIKLIYEKPPSDDRSGATKIRKMAVKADQALTLDSLRECFSLKGKQSLLYYDDDGDQITIANDRELLTAIEERLSDTLRLYTPLEENEVESGSYEGSPHTWRGEKEFGKALHPFTNTCTNCQSCSGRFSYKCVICSNIELCGRCEAFGVHSEHDIIRLENGKTYPRQFFIRLHRLYDKMNQTQSMISLHPLSSPPTPAAQFPALGTIPSTSEPSSVGVMEDFELLPADSAPLTVRQLSLSDDDSLDTKTLISPTSSEGDTYRGVLQAPVEVLLKDEFQVHEAREANSEEIAGSLRGLRKEIDKLLDSDDDCLQYSDKSKSHPIVKSDLVENESNVDRIKVISIEEPSYEPVSNRDEKERNGFPVVESTPSESPKSSSTYEYVHAYSPRTRDLLHQSSVYSLKYGQRSSYLSSTTTQKVSDSLEQMKAMGFSDDDGWLTQILTMERGNIDKVLDILTPVNK